MKSLCSPSSLFENPSGSGSFSSIVEAMGVCFEIVRVFEMMDCNSAKTSMEAHLNLEEDEGSYQESDVVDSHST